MALNKATTNSDFSENEEDFLRDKESSLCLKIPEFNPDKVELLNELDNLVVGHKEAKQDLVDAIVDNLDSVRPKEGPLGVFFYAGPTGVGKTHLAKSLAEILLGNKEGIVKINCEDYQRSHDTKKLFGAPPSYVGYGEPTPLTSDNVYKAANKARENESMHPLIRRLNNFSIIVFDEIEKAHPKVHQSLLGLLDEGKMTFSTGSEDDVNIKFSKETNFSNSIIIMTSNIGAEAANKEPIGFTGESSTEEINKSYIEEYGKEFTPEFRNRVDNVSVLKKLSKEQSREILQKHLEDYKIDLNRYWFGNLTLEVSDDIVAILLDKGFSEEKGGRNLKRVFKKYFETPVEQTINASTIIWESGDEKRYIVNMTLDHDGEYCFILNHDSSPIKIGEENNVNLQTEKVKGGIKQTLSLSNKPASMKEVVAECISLQARYVKLYNLREEEDLDFSDKLDEILDKLSSYGYSDEDIQELRDYESWKYFKNFDFVDTYEGMVFPEDIFPVITVEIVGSIIQKRLDRWFSKGIAKKIDIKGNGSLVEDIEELVETVIGRRLNKLQLDTILSMVDNYYKENKIQR